MIIDTQKFNIKDLLLLKSKVFTDDRGYFMEGYKEFEFRKFGLPLFKQDNISYSKKSVLRGLHYQIAPKAQGKLVRCLEGKIWDVAVDIRRESQTFGKWQGVELSEADGQALFVPEGFAHGFVVLTDSALVLYKTTVEYAPELEQGIIWNDPILNIKWPVSSPILANRDKNFPQFNNLTI